jgi:hypothetical protein
MMRALIAIALALLLTGCAAGTAVSVAPGYRYTLQPPAAGPKFTALQEIVITAPNGREERIVSQLENDETSMRLAALTPLGQTLLTAHFDGRTVQTKSALPLAPVFDAGFVIALIQLALWPEHSVAQGLNVGMRLVTQGNNRELEGGGKILWTINVRGAGVPYDSVHIRSEDARLALRITTLAE